MKSVRNLILTLAALSAATDAFAPAKLAQRSTTMVALEAERSDVSGFARFFGIVAAASIFTLNTPDASAVANHSPAMPFSSSSIEIADEIKQLDMSLPSYGEIKDSKASVATVKSLSVDNKGKGVGLMSKKRSYPTADTPANVEPKRDAPTPSSATYNF